MDGILADLGVSSYQIDKEERGFTYQGKTKMDMRMNTKDSIDAIEVINTYDQEKLEDIFSKYGDIQKPKKIVKEINQHEDNIARLENESFPLKTDQFIDEIKKGSSLNKILPEAFALVREASRRINQERHFDVQLIGGIALHENKIAEMKTGEGKTLTIVLAAYLNALEKNCLLYTSPSPRD